MEIQLIACGKDDGHDVYAVQDKSSGALVAYAHINSRGALARFFPSGDIKTQVAEMLKGGLQ